MEVVPCSLLMASSSFSVGLLPAVLTSCWNLSRRFISVSSWSITEPALDFRKLSWPSFWLSTFRRRYARPAFRSSKDVPWWFSSKNQPGEKLSCDKSPHLR